MPLVVTLGKTRWRESVFQDDFVTNGRVVIIVLFYYSSLGNLAKSYVGIHPLEGGHPLLWGTLEPPLIKNFPCLVCFC